MAARPPVFYDPSAPPASFAPSFPASPSAPVFVSPPPPKFDWSGLYLGLNAGYVFNARTPFVLTGTDAATNALLAAGAVPGAFALSTGGFTGGGQVGFNKQLDPMLIPPLAKIGAAPVVGFEVDAAYTGVSAFGTLVGVGNTATTLHSRTEFVGTARVRLGLAFDRLLIYGTGGLAFGGVDKAANVVTGAGVNLYSGSSSGLQVGYAYGGGAAYAFPATPLFMAFKSPAVTVKLEYIHYDLGTSTFVANSTTGAGNAFNVRSGDSGNLIRAGINYKFDLKVPPPPY